MRSTLLTGLIFLLITGITSAQTAPNQSAGLDISPVELSLGRLTHLREATGSITLKKMAAIIPHGKYSCLRGGMVRTVRCLRRSSAKSGSFSK